MSIKPKHQNQEDKDLHWMEKLRATEDLRVTFNFSFLTSDDKYNLSNTSINLQAMLDKLETLSQRTWVAILNLPRSSGLEQVEKKKIDGRLKKMPIPDGFGKKRTDLSNGKLVIIRFNSQQSRMIGKLIDQTYYLFWIDADHELYNG